MPRSSSLRVAVRGTGLHPALRAWAALVLAWFTSTPWAAGVEIIVGAESAAYREAADVLREELAARAEVTVVTPLPPSAGTRGRADANVVITLGPQALEVALTSRTAPIVALLTTRASFERALNESASSRNAKRATAVYLDQPFARQLALVQLMLPGRQRIGVLVSPDSRDLLPTLEAAARQRNLQLASETVTKAAGIYAALTRLLPATDALLAIPDPAIFNANTLSNILLTTYRVEQPVFGFSPAYVKAGALAAVYSTPRQLARQAAELARAILGGAGVPAPQYPRTFSVDVNSAVARSLGLSIEDAVSLSAKLNTLDTAR